MKAMHRSVESSGTVPRTRHGRTRRLRVSALGAVNILLSAGLWPGTPTLANEPPLWVKELGSADAHFFPTGIATDGDGNIVVSGVTDGALGGPGQGATDTVVAKYAADGQLLWIRQFGTPDYDASGGGIATDGGGNVFVAGQAIDPSYETSYAWVAKYDGSGRFLWQGQRHASQWDDAQAVAADGSGNVVVAGTTIGAPETYVDGWVAKYDPDGRLKWTRRLDAADYLQSYDPAFGVATDGSGNVLVCGLTEGSLAGPTRGSYDGWVVKYDPDGRVLWKHQIGTATGESAKSVTADGNGNVIVAGTTDGSFAGPSRGKDDVWVVKYNAAGRFMWRRQLGTDTNDDVTGVVADMDGAVILAGNTNGSFATRPRSRRGDVWLAKFSPDGGLEWKRQFGTSFADSGEGVATDGAGDVFITGRMRGSAVGPNPGRSVGFLAKYPGD